MAEGQSQHDGDAYHQIVAATGGFLQDLSSVLVRH